MPRLDGLRGIAILGVLFEHFCPSGRIRSLSPGGAGVTLFFVLSGYLITRILLGYKSTETDRGAAARHFYLRRFLRLSPPYYLAILIAVCLGLAGLRLKWWIPALYLTNFDIAIRGTWPGTADHFWSLAVEEQFYIIWFCAVVVLPARYFMHSVVCAITTGVFFRLIIYCFSLNPLYVVLLPGHVGTLATGALIAYSENKPNCSRIENFFLGRSLLVISGVLFTAISVTLPRFLFPRVVLYPLVASIFFGCLVRQAVTATPNPWLDWLRWNFLRHIGKISYGVYVYHAFIPARLIMLILGHSPWLVFLGRSMAAIGIAELSWIFLEKRVLALKDVLSSSINLRPRCTVERT